jgi:hypothetical protein
MMCCGICSRWQHIPCHDAADQQAGRRKRNWDTVEFTCQQCQLRTAAARHPSLGYGPMQMQYPSHQVQNPYSHLVSGSSYPQQSQPQSGAYLRHNENYGTPTLINTMSYTRGHPAAAPHQQPYTSSLSFTHYQPHLREFSSSPHNYSSHTQAGGYPNQLPYPQHGIASGAPHIQVSI